MSKILNEEIISVKEIAYGIFKMTIASEYISKHSLPGQFINIKCSNGFDAFLRRPISICSVCREKGVFDIIFQVRGKGTEYLSRKKTGTKLDFIGPLGNIFDLNEKYERIAVVGGGIGIFPLLFLLNEKNNYHKSAFIGFKNKDCIVLKEEFKRASETFMISTDDGSEGTKGLITHLLEKEIKKNQLDIIYTCGPLPMMKEVVRLADTYAIKCQVSLEQRMGCGIGACLVCACKTKHGEGWKYSHVCRDGPIFWSDKIIL